MIGVVQERDIVGPLIFRKFQKSLDLCLPAAISEKAQHVRHGDWVVEPAGANVRLTNDHQRRAVLIVEQPFHRGQRDRLIARYVATLSISCRKYDHERCYQPGYDSKTYEGSAEVLELMHQQIECAERRHHYRTRYHRRRHVVKVLPNDPRVGEQSSQTG